VLYATHLTRRQLRTLSPDSLFIEVVLDNLIPNSRDLAV
jgi:hypothetical protein